MWNMFGFSRPTMITGDEALPGRAQRSFSVPEAHAVLGRPLLGPWPNAEVIYLAMGCFWGAERKLWSMPAVVSTAVGYMGGYTPNPTYEEVCSGRTGHTEAVLVAYDPRMVGTFEILKCFWENHDPTQGFRQGNDIGTQYRSAIYWTTSEQEHLALVTAESYDKVLRERGLDPVTTQIEPAANHPFYVAEDYHQQYLAKNPNGYDCHAHTGIDLPPVVVS